MSSVLIQHYLAELAKLRQVGGTHRESVVREAFKDLLKGWGRALDLTFVPEYEIESPAKERRYVDGALVYGLRLPFGYWEAKDERDDLDAEIELKFKRGYPQDNIVFEDSREAVLIQNKREVIRCAVDDVDKLQRLLELYFGYERPEIAEFRKAVDQFKADLPAVCDALRDMIERAYTDNSTFRAAADKFLKQARETINPSLAEADVREILIQHILTEEIFALVFPGSNYHEDNNIARELYKLEHTFFTGNTKHQTLKALEPYYAAIRRSAGQIASHHEKQTFLKVVYENFYKVYNPKAADRLGVVYTPNEIVRFMIESTDWLCEKHFSRNLIDRDVEILDPAAGTGTFISELLEHFRGQPAKLKHKYLEELHANEVAILPYYVANLNIEATYAAISGEYLEYPNLCFVDTLDNVAGLRRYSGQQIADLFGMGEENVERIKRQNRRKISVVIGNPPYNANQANENDNNKNREYPDIDARIKDTYIKASTAQKTKLYDMYARFFRWASDRIAENGVVAFISNRSYVDSRTFDGFRDVVAREFNEIHIVDLGADVRANPKLSGTKHNVFGIQTGVAIGFLVKRAKTQGCRIFYSRRPEFETAEEKLAWLSKARFDRIEHTEIRPDAKHNWLNLTDNDFDSLLPVASKAAKAAKKPSQEKAIFKLFSLGVVTNRDEWVYDDSESALRAKVEFLIDAYNADVERLSRVKDPKQRAEMLDSAIKWTRAVKRDAANGLSYNYADGEIVESYYRPFVKRELYFSRRLNEMVYQVPQLFGAEAGPNRAFCFSAEERSEFGAIAFDEVPNKDIFMPSAAQVLALYRYGSGNRVDNITDWALKQFKDHYKNVVTPAKAGAQRLSVSAEAESLGYSPHPAARPDGPPARAGMTSKASPNPHPALRATFSRREKGNLPRAQARAITKLDIFHYVYAVLHDPVYRDKYAQNLKREFPRIPFYPDFWRWADWGKALMDLHIGYESIEPWPLKRTDIADEKARKNGASPKAMLKADKDAGRIVLDSETTLAGVPTEAWNYKLGNRAALEWILDQYKEKKPKDPTIRERFNTYRFADYKDKVIDLLARVTRVSVDTQAIVEAMRTAPRNS
ncbi:MAG TPA: type ISP restriction/modification enzyme [Rhodanobacteraceae bacterium]|nr:type ISP restriction/modification enzyme [Rhodanobacteraceae bacterium]